MKAKLLKDLRNKYKYKFKEDKVFVLDYRYSEIKTFNSVYKALQYILYIEHLRSSDYGSFGSRYSRLKENLEFRQVQRNFNKI